MKIYHGTAFENLEVILKEGIAPRGTGEGNWKTEHISRPDMVYMTVAYPFYFALAAKGDSDKKLVFEIDFNRLDERKLYPDEDFIAQAANDLPNHAKYREGLEKYKDMWRLSLDKMGNICYKGKIPRRAITRYCIFDIRKGAMIAMSILDPSISILNYRLCGEYYKEMITWLFGDRKDFPTKIKEEWMPNEEMKKQQRDFTAKMSADRSAIEIHVLDKS